MLAGPRRAAQYIRMSTDRQDLSPLIQKDAIAAFAVAHAIEIVKSYEDAGKSGVDMTNRPRLKQLLKDVAEGAQFSEILVYDVSRWGRFQDTDAAAYHEYHCRLHGVQVIYVSESFANDHAPGSVLIKSMRRVMAAEYSRDIAWKSRAGQQRVVAMGFQMGPLPPLGYRRCAVSADRRRRKLLEHGEQKPTLTDRVEWVLGPDNEVELVRRICRAYVGGLQLEEIASLVQAQGWRTNKGRLVSTRAIKILLTNEALIGNFVWGVKSKGGKVINCSPTRRDGSIPRIIDDATWKAVSARIRSVGAQPPTLASDSEGDGRRGARRRKPRQLALPFEQNPQPATYRRSLGSAQQLRDHAREFGRALCTFLNNLGIPTGFDPRVNVLTFWSARVRIRLMWPTSPSTWRLEKSRSTQGDHHVLVARMAAMYRPTDFFVLPPGHTGFPQEIGDGVPRRLLALWCASAEVLTNRLSQISGASCPPAWTGRVEPEF